MLPLSWDFLLLTLDDWSFSPDQYKIINTLSYTSSNFSWWLSFRERVCTDFSVVIGEYTFRNSSIQERNLKGPLPLQKLS